MQSAAHGPDAQNVSSTFTCLLTAMRLPPPQAQHVVPLRRAQSVLVVHALRGLVRTSIGWQ